MTKELGKDGLIQEVEDSSWKKDKSLVNILETYSAKIIEEKGRKYNIEFFDYDGSVVEATMLKKNFKDLPYPVKAGSYFWIVLYEMKDSQKSRLSVWPVAKYWHKSW